MRRDDETSWARALMNARNPRIIHTIGYSKWSREALLARTRSLNGLLIDVRYSPYSRARPEFNREELARAFPDYRHVEQYGNRNFRGGPVELAAPDDGARLVMELAASRDKNLVLLCACGRHENCHRSRAATHLRDFMLAADIPCTVDHLYPDGQGLLFE